MNEVDLMRYNIGYNIFYFILLWLTLLRKGKVG